MAAVYTGKISTDVSKLVEMEKEVLTLRRQMAAKAKETREIYDRIGGETYIKPHFYVDGDIDGVARTDLGYTLSQFTTSISNMEKFQGEGVVTNAVEDAVTLITGALDVLRTR